jgi:2-deoxy-D-gluconate 3-dehydrogenase
MILDRFRLDRRIALVTGGTRGLGQAMAIGLAEAGADIALLSKTAAGETAETLRRMGRRCLVLALDLSCASRADLEGAVDEVVSELGGLDILVNNAGIIRRASALEFSEEDWNEVLQVNLHSLFFLSQAAAKRMVSRGGGKIVNVASVLSFQGGILVSAYAAAKSGVAGLTRALANEWAAKNVNVNAIAPGYMATDNTAALRADPMRNQAILDRIPARRWGAVDDLKGAVVFLASSASDYMHGAVVPVDGGWLSR